MIEVFLIEAIKLVKVLLSVKIKRAKLSPARVYFLIYTELREIEQQSNYFLLWMRRWIDEYDQHSHPLYEAVYNALEAIASSLLRLKEFIDREYGIGLRVYDERLEKTLHEVIGLKFIRLRFWIYFFECKKLAEKKMLLRFTKIRAKIDTNFELIRSGDELIRTADTEMIETIQRLLHQVYGANTEQVSVEDFDKLELMIRDGQDTVWKLHVALEEFSDFIRKNFQISDLFDEKTSYIFKNSD